MSKLQLNGYLTNTIVINATIIFSIGFREVNLAKDVYNGIYPGSKLTEQWVGSGAIIHTNNARPPESMPPSSDTQQSYSSVPVSYLPVFFVREL